MRQSAFLKKKEPKNPTKTNKKQTGMQKQGNWFTGNWDHPEEGDDRRDGET